MRICICFAILTTVLSLPVMSEVPDSMLPGGVFPGTTASVFAPDLVSSAADEYGVTVDSDWTEVYFTRVRGEQSVIMKVSRVGKSWSSATPASFSGQHNDSHPWMSPDGERVYFISMRPCRGASQALNVWFAERSPEGWTGPSPLGKPVTDQMVHAPSVSMSGTIYASGLIRLQHVGGQYLPKEHLKPDIKGSHPAVASDESFVVFSARRQDGFGSKDLYVVFQKPDSSWTDPVNLGKGVNSEHQESSPTLSSDGRVLFFSRNDDVWWVDASVIEEVRPGHSPD